jgi:uncharacterized protein with PIN domain
MTSFTEPELMFITDNMLRGLARWLRFLGFSTIIASSLENLILYNKSHPKAISVTSSKKHFDKLPQDRRMLLQTSLIEDQICEMNVAFQIFKKINFLSRCSICNEILHEVPKNSLITKVPQKVLLSFNSFKQCPSCQRVFWEGCHILRMRDKLRQMNIPI